MRCKRCSSGRRQTKEEVRGGSQQGLGRLVPETERRSSVCVSVYLSLCLHVSVRVYLYLCVCVCDCVCVFVCLCVSESLCVSVCFCVSGSMCVSVCLSLHVCVCVWVPECVCVCMQGNRVTRAYKARNKTEKIGRASCRERV